MTNLTPIAPDETCAYWSLDGARSGPNLRVTGGADVLGAVAARLSALPSLVYLRGSLTLDAEAQSGGDELLDLTGIGADEAYWWVLARAAALGMISGRGIPASWLAAA